jgi:hypothetical protein
MLDNVGVGRVQWGIPKGYPHPPSPPPGGGGGGARVVPDALLYNNEKPRCKNSGVIVLLLFTCPS